MTKPAPSLWNDSWTDGERVGPDHPAAEWLGYSNRPDDFYDIWPNGLQIKSYPLGEEEKYTEEMEKLDVFYIPVLPEETSASVGKSNDDSGSTSGENSKAVNRGTRLQLSPDTETKIPVLYGRTVTSGKIIDAELFNSNRSLIVAMVLAQTTGTTIAGDPSTYEVKNIYMDNMKMSFDDSYVAGYRVTTVEDTEGNTIADFSGNVIVWVYNESDGILPVTGFATKSSLIDARDLMPSWTPSHRMTGMLFALVAINYDDDVGLDKIPDFKFDIQNSMNQPGDCLNDFLTNTVYGCGLPSSIIKVS
jgi:hypothetical protein